MNLHEKLKEIISEKNKKYEQLNDEVYALEKLENPNKDDLKWARFQRWQFIHEYATHLGNLLLTETTQLTKADMSLFDLVPYNVWEKMTAKSLLIIMALKEKEK